MGRDDGCTVFFVEKTAGCACVIALGRHRTARSYEIVYQKKIVNGVAIVSTLGVGQTITL